MEVNQNICKHCNEILGDEIIEREKSFDELVSEVRSSRREYVIYDEANKLRTSGIIKWLLQNATEKTIDLSDIDKIVDECIYSDELEIIEILKSHEVMIEIPQTYDNKKKWLNSAMCYAVKLGTPEIITWLLSFQINAFIREQEYLPVLDEFLVNAAEAGNLNAIKILISLGANPHHFDDHGESKTILEISSELGYYHVVEWLLDNVENHIVESIARSLQYAIEEKQYDIVEFLVECNCIDMKCTELTLGNQTFIHVAAINGNINVIKYLLDKGTELLVEDEEGSTVTHFAAQYGHLNLLKWLDTQGAIKHTRNFEYSPLFNAAETNKLECIKYLVHKNYNVNRKSNEDQSVLHLAVVSGNIEVVKFLLAHGANPLTVDNLNNTLLHASQHTNLYLDEPFVKQTTIDLVTLLASFGIDIRAKNSCGETLLHLALSRSDYLVVRWLLEQGMDTAIVLSSVNHWIPYCSKNNDWRLFDLSLELTNDINQLNNGETLLYSCARNPQAVLKLINCNADVNIRKSSNGSTPLMKSLSDYFDKEGEAAKILMDHGADINVVSKTGETALYHAIHKNKNLEIIKKLIELGADVNAGNALRRCIILHAAVRRGDLDIVKCIVEAGADVNCIDNDNESAITLKSNHVTKWEIIKYLVESGADVNYFSTRPLLCDAIDTGDVELVASLLRNGANPNMAIQDENPILHLCTDISDQESKIEILKLLISHGADINELNDVEETILFHFIDNLNIVDYLIRMGIDINRDDTYGAIALHDALKLEKFKNNIENQIKIVLKLIHHGSNINQADTNKRTPLHLAVANPHCSVVARIMVQKGADLNAIDDEGSSILHKTCLGELGMYLISKGANVNAKNNQGVTVLHKALKNLYKKNVKCDRNILTMLVNRSVKKESISSTTLASMNDSRYVEFIHLLIDTVQDVNTTIDDGQSALHYCIATDNVDILDHLLKRGAHLLSRTMQGDSILHLASQKNSINIVKYILSEVNHELLFKPNNEFETPLFIAMKFKHENIVDLLLKSPLPYLNYDLYFNN